MYILPKDIHKDTIDIIPYGFEVEIIKDCTSLRNDIADVFNVIERNSHNYMQTIEKVRLKSLMKLLLFLIILFDFSLSKLVQSCCDIMTSTWISQTFYKAIYDIELNLRMYISKLGTTKNHIISAF